MTAMSQAGRPGAGMAAAWWPLDGDDWPAAEGAAADGASRTPEAAVLPLSLLTKPSVGVMTSVYLICSVAGYFIARSTFRRAAPEERSTVAVKAVSPRKRGSPPAL